MFNEEKTILLFLSTIFIMVEIGNKVLLKELCEVGHLVGNIIWYDNETDEIINDKRYPGCYIPFGKKMIVVKIEENMNPNSIAISAQNRKNDWKHWWWIPERYIKEVLK